MRAHPWSRLRRTLFAFLAQQGRSGKDDRRSPRGRRPDVEELEPRLALSAWYVAPSGSDTNPGTILQPFASLAHASAVADPGDTVFARGGLYLPTSMQYLTGSGTASGLTTRT